MPSIDHNILVVCELTDDWKVVTALWPQTSSQIFDLGLIWIRWNDIEILIVVRLHMICSLGVDECFFVASKIHKRYNPMFPRRKLGVRVPSISDLDVEVLVYRRVAIWQIH